MSSLCTKKEHNLSAFWLPQRPGQPWRMPALDAVVPLPDCGLGTSPIRVLELGTGGDPVAAGSCFSLIVATKYRLSALLPRGQHEYPPPGLPLDPAGPRPQPTWAVAPQKMNGPSLFRDFGQHSRQCRTCLTRVLILIQGQVSVMMRQNAHCLSQVEMCTQLQSEPEPLRRPCFGQLLHASCR